MIETKGGALLDSVALVVFQAYAWHEELCRKSFLVTKHEFDGLKPMGRTSKPPTLESSVYSAVQSLPEMWLIAARQFASVMAVCDPRSKPEIKLTYAQLYEQMQHFASGLQALGIQVTSLISLRLFSKC